MNLNLVYEDEELDDISIIADERNGSTYANILNLKKKGQLLDFSNFN